MGLSKLSVQYLDSIISILKNKHIKPVLLASPLHQNYRDNIPSHILSEYSEIRTRYKNTGTSVIDLSVVNYPDSLYFDADHLNKEGAAIFTVSRSLIF
ncbi:MAG: hypothetical protein U5L96_10880 [Owenweeksia sp.]|nr:hypothetical protein [Owenweeksia sp.]